MRTVEIAANQTFAELVERAETDAALQDFAAARDRYEAVLETLRNDHADHPIMVRVLVGLGWCLQALGDSEAALRLHEEALATQLHRAPDATAAICTIRRGIGSALIALGRLEEAQQQSRQVLEKQRDLLGSGDAEVAATLNILGETAARLEQTVTQGGIRRRRSRSCARSIRRTRPRSRRHSPISAFRCIGWTRSRQPKPVCARHCRSIPSCCSPRRT